MESDSGKLRRPAVCYFCFLAFLLFSHLPLISLPYYWDEAGQFVPAALDILRGGHWIPQSVEPNVHPPAVMAYLAAVWRLAGFHPAITRLAMLWLASFGVFATVLLSRQLSPDLPALTAILTAALLSVSPVFFAQSMLAQLDAPALVFTVLAFLLFLRDRIALSSLVCVVLVLVKETSLVVPAVFACWLAGERRWKAALWFLLPALPLAAWLAVLDARTHSWAGNPDFVRYNLVFAFAPLSLILRFLRRLHYLFFADFHWVGALAILAALRSTSLFRTRGWRVAWLLVAAHVAMLTLLGGAILQRYLVPVLPILYAAMVAALWRCRGALRPVAIGVLLAGLAACNFLNPPYPFPYDDNLAFTDFLRLHQTAADWLDANFPDATVYTVWPVSAELSRPDLGFVRRPLHVRLMPQLTVDELRATDWNHVEILLAYSRSWDSPYTLAHLPWVARLRSRLSDYRPDPRLQEVRSHVPFPVTAHFERRGQWVDIFVNPAFSHP